MGETFLAILALGFLIVVHEAGHYFVARWCHMRVERFSVGFGPGILKRRARSGTIFQLAPIPFGGFVEIRGMNIAEEVDPDDINAYPNRPAWQRFITILAGPATNYISAIFLAFALYMCHGQPGTTWYVDNVKEGSDARGKLQHGDRIIAIDGEEIFGPSPGQLSERVNAKRATLLIKIDRNGKVHSFPLTPKLALADDGTPVIAHIPRVVLDATGRPQLDPDGTPKIRYEPRVQYRLGLELGIDIHDVGIAEAAYDAFAYPIHTTAAIFAGFRDIFAGRADADPTGPVGIINEFSKAFDRGLPDGIKLLMALSVYLGLFNLVPLPALDGGRLVFLLYEMVTRRRANPRIETMVHMGGIMVLMVVMILVTLKDCSVL